MCVLSRDNTDLTDVTFIANPAGPVTVKIVPTSGTVTLTVATNITDSTGAVVAGTQVSADGLSFSFTTKTGKNYVLNTVYQCVPPNSTGMLVESCPRGIKLADILSTTTGQNFIVKA